MWAGLGATPKRLSCSSAREAMRASKELFLHVTSSGECESSGTWNCPRISTASVTTLLAAAPAISAVLGPCLDRRDVTLLPPSRVRTTLTQPCPIYQTTLHAIKSLFNWFYTYRPPAPHTAVRWVRWKRSLGTSSFARRPFYKHYSSSQRLLPRT